MNLTSSPGRLVGGQVSLPKPRLMTHRVMVVVPGSPARTAPVAKPAARFSRTAEKAQPTVVRPVPTELLPELTGRGPADATYEGRLLDPRPEQRPARQPAQQPDPRPSPQPRRSPADWAAAAATAAADRKKADLTGVGQLLAGQQKNPDRTAPTTPRED
jgi:hypothetical protein